MEEQTTPIITPHIYESYKDPDAHVHTVGEAIDQALTELEEWQVRTSLPGIPSGFPSIDNITMGWKTGEFIIIAGRPSTGRTTLALNMMRNAAVDHLVPSLYFSFGVSADSLARKMTIAESGLNSDAMHGSRKLEVYEWEQLETKLKALSKAPIYIDDAIRLTTDDIGEVIMKATREKGVRLVLIDDFNSITTPIDYRGNKEAEMSNIALELKRIAREQNVVIIAIAMLSRNSVNNYGRNGASRPQLSDLKDTSALENNADKIFFIHRPDYMGLSENPEDIEKAILILAKNRSGDTRDINLKFKPEHCMFVEAEESLDYISASPIKSSINGYDFGNSDF